MPKKDVAKSFIAEVSRLARAETTTETSYYPAIKRLLEALLEERGLKFEVRSGTNEDRVGGGRDQPDIAIYDGNGDYVVVAGEVKTPVPELTELATSEERNDQIGRYLALTHVVILCNVRSFGLLTVRPGVSTASRVRPGDRLLEETVTLWPTLESLKRGEDVSSEIFREVGELIEAALSRFAVLASPEVVAKVLARQARQAKLQLPQEFTRAVSGLAEDFHAALGITFDGEEGEEFFRSSLIQTVFYGLFAGWTLWIKGGMAGEFRWEELTRHLKIPFLGELFHELQHPTRIEELGLRPYLDRATETLRRVNREEFFAKFTTVSVRSEENSGAAATSAILYFYEPFLEAFDPELRKELGVWYTPEEIVRYQVRNVDRILRKELGCERGLADEKVVILDPCCGTGAYLLEILQTISSQLASEGAGDLLAERLLSAATHRLIGFEILTAPFVIAQLQMYLLLSEAGAAPSPNERPSIFLTNALTGWDGPDQVKLHFPELQAEHDAAQKVKRGGKIIVILGNPPYNRFAGVPLEEEADLVDHYKGIRRNSKGKQIGSSRLYTEWKVRKQLLDDLYIRFFRLAERCIGERAEYGVVSFISNYSFYTGRSHPLMRESLLQAFDSIWIDNLNGDKYKTGKVIPAGLSGEGSSDQSVFSTSSDARGIQVRQRTKVKIEQLRELNDEAVRLGNFWLQRCFPRDAIESMFVHAPALIEASLRSLLGQEVPAIPFPAVSYYTALAEALFSRGDRLDDAVALMRILRSMGYGTRIIDADTKLNQLDLDAFGTPATARMQAFWEEELTACSSDLDLLELVVKVRHSPTRASVTWLDAVIARDLSSESAFKRARAVCLRGFTEVQNTTQWLTESISDDDSWPRMVLKTAQRRVKTERDARYWFKNFCQEDELDKAWAAFRLFLTLTDRRCWLWCFAELSVLEGDHPKRRFFESNREEIRKGCKENEDKLQKAFIGCDIVDEMYPWRR